MGARESRRNGEGSFELLADLTARLASTANLDSIADRVASEIAALGFGMVWLARFDRVTGRLHNLVELLDGADVTAASPEVVLDARRPIGHGFRERRFINVRDPDALFILDDDGEPIPPGILAVPRGMYQHLGGRPFACGPLLGSDGAPVGAIGLCSYRGRQPIPDEMLDRGMLRALIDHLGIAAERAAHLARLERMSADLVRVQEVVTRDARLRSVGELAAAVAHDLNHLSGIALMAVSSGMRSPEAAREALAPIERASRSIGDLVARLQRVARAGAGSPGESGTARPDEIAQDILLMMGPVLREQSIDVDLEVEGRAPAVRADPAILHQVILNLVLNARDALASVDADRRALRIRIEADAAAVRIAVADTGPGVPPDEWSRLFQPFVTTKGSDHLGLGLAAARASLERMGGQLSGRNGPGGGAVFEVRLPRAAADSPSRALASPAATPAPASRGAEVLVIDDDRDLVDIIDGYLAPLGYRISTATTAAQAFELAAARDFDLVLCDVGLPHRSGPEICRELRRSGFAGAVVLMTGWDDQQLAAEQPDADYDQILRKPFFGADLLRAIESALSD
jgi:signal transduction histidine kinase/CheY-like chemotaxis protein